MGVPPRRRHNPFSKWDKIFLIGKEDARNMRRSGVERTSLAFLPICATVGGASMALSASFCSPVGTRMFLFVIRATVPCAIGGFGSAAPGSSFGSLQTACQRCCSAEQTQVADTYLRELTVRPLAFATADELLLIRSSASRRRRAMSSADRSSSSSSSSKWMRLLLFCVGGGTRPTKLLAGRSIGDAIRVGDVATLDMVRAEEVEDEGEAENFNAARVSRAHQGGNPNPR